MKSLDPNSNEVLDSILVKYFEACEAGPSPVRDAFINAHEEFANDPKLIEQFDSFLQGERLFHDLSDTIFLPEQGQFPVRNANSNSDFDADALPPALGNGQPFGKYILLDEIARGGMGVVYRAKQENLSRVVAIKMILSGNFASEEHRRRFQLEAQAAANLHHANIVAIYDVGEHDGRAFFAMQYIDGKTLTELTQNSPIDIQQAASWIATTADAVHYAHEKGTLHRDLKPSNILIDDHGQPQIMDFGLAKQADQEPLLTTTGAILGTPGFMSPEQARSDNNQIDRTTDVYSLGATLYYLLTRQPPLVGESTLETLQKITNSRPLPPRQIRPEIPRDIENICLKCLEKDASARYSTARELADDLRRFLKGEAVHARPVNRMARIGRWAQRHPAKVVTGLLAFLVLFWACWMFSNQLAIKALDRQTIPYEVKRGPGESGFLTATVGEKITLIFENETNIDAATRVNGEFYGRGGSAVEIHVDEKQTQSRGVNGPEGISRLTINGHVVELFDHGRKLMVRTPEGSGVTYHLNAYENLIIVFDVSGQSRELRE